MVPPEAILAVSFGELPAQLGHIFYFIVLPVLLLAGIGFLLQRALGLDMPTLTRLNFYFVIPAIIYFKLVTARVALDDVGTVILFALVVMAAQTAVTWLAAVARKVPRDQRSAMLMTSIFNNSGNYGLPLQELAFRSAGLSDAAVIRQVFFMLFQNVTGFTLGIGLAAHGTRRRALRETLGHIARFPPLYTLAAALLTVQIRTWIGPGASGRVVDAMAPFVQVITYVKDAFMAIAIVTLGAQLALVARGKHGYPVTLSVALRLLAGPAIGLAVIYLMGIQGFLAQVLLISTSTPTAVNCMLLCLEFDNHPDFAARSVFYSTLLSPVTVTLTIFLAQSGLLPGFAI